MPIEIKKRKTGKYSLPKPSAKKRTPKKSPKGGMPFLAPRQKEKMDQLTGRGKPLEAKSGGVMKMKGGGIGKLASILSPAYGIMKGQGPFSKIASMGPSTNALSVFAKSQSEDAKRRKAEMSGAGQKGSNRMTPMTGMMAGGPLKRKKSIDGCAMKGKTRAV